MLQNYEKFIKISSDCAWVMPKNEGIKKTSFVRTAKITVLFYALSYYHLYVEDWVSKYLFTYPGGAWGEVLLIPDLVENAHEIT